VPHDFLERNAGTDFYAVNAEATVGGLTIPAGSTVGIQKGVLKYIELPEETALTADGQLYPGGSDLQLIELGGALEVMFVVLGGDATLGKLAFSKGDQVSVIGGQPSAATLSSGRQYGGTAYNAGDLLTFGPDAEVTSRATADEVAAADAADRRARRAKRDALKAQREAEAKEYFDGARLHEKCNKACYGAKDIGKCTRECKGE
jgi:hypothetical protein